MAMCTFLYAKELTAFSRNCIILASYYGLKAVFRGVFPYYEKVHFFIIFFTVSAFSCFFDRFRVV